MIQFFVLIALLLSFPVMGNAQSRVTTDRDVLFTNSNVRPYVPVNSEPRKVTNILPSSHRVYNNTNWTDFPTDTAAIVWGGDVDGGQWYEVTTQAAGIQRAWGQVGFTGQIGETYIVSFTVVSKSGTIGGQNFALTVCAASSSPQAANNVDLGRNAVVLTLITGGSCVGRIGIGTGANNAADGTLRIADVMVERVQNASTRLYPYEYVTPGDSRIFPYTYTATLGGTGGTAVLNVTTGTRQTIPASRSVLVVGDSFANDATDFPMQMRSVLYNKNFAVSYRAASGYRIDQIDALIDAAFAETTYTTGVQAWTTVVCEGGINDVAQGASLSTIQSRRLAQIAKVKAYGAKVVLHTLAPWNAASGAQNTIIADYNTWIKTLGYPVYDMNADANNGSNQYKTNWVSGDGLHPGGGYYQGSFFIAERFANLLMSLP